ncbi:MAG TPA: polysaccharide deacetylase family protein [Bacillota bacterium]|nr:polysaccharide deacetylase family protein [Bacillota bacterium]
MRVKSIRTGVVALPQLFVTLCAVVLGAGSFVYTGTPHGPALPSLSQSAQQTHLQPLLGSPGVVAGAHTERTADCVQTPCLALTFDDGPQPQVTPQVLDILARHHVHATFFLIGLHVPGNEALVQRMYKEGHEIGNHSWSHVDFTALAPDEMEDQIARTQAAITAAGVPAPRLFRPPYGAINPLVRSHVPLTIALWNADPEDWHKARAAQIVTSVEAAAGRGKVIDMHDIKQPTADALDQILTDLQSQYQLVTISELFNLAPGQSGVFYGR